VNIEENAVELIINFFKNYGEKAFSKQPEEVVEEVMNQLRQQGLSVKFALRMFWGRIERILSNPDQLLEDVRKRDVETYNMINSNRDWYYRFMDKLRVELKNFIS